VIQLTKHAARSTISTPTADKIRLTALNLFFEHGFERVSLRDLAAETRIQPGSLYNHIESKQSLLFDLIEEHETGLQAALITSIHSYSTPSDRLDIFLDTYIRFQLANPHGAALARLELRSLNRDQRKALSKIRASYLAAFEVRIAGISSYISLKNIDIKYIAFGLLEMLNGLASNFPVMPEASITSQLVRISRSMALGAIDNYLKQRLCFSPIASQCAAEQ